MNLGIALQAAGDLDSAIAPYKLAVVLDPRFPAAHYNLALANLSLSHHSDAEEGFRAALRLREDFPDAWVGLADALEAIIRGFRLALEGG